MQNLPSADELKAAYERKCIVRTASSYNNPWAKTTTNGPGCATVRSCRTPITHSWNGQVQIKGPTLACSVVTSQSVLPRKPHVLLGWKYPCSPVERLAFIVCDILKIPHNYATGFLTYIVKTPHAWTPCADHITAVNSAIQHSDFGESLGNPNIAVVMNALTQSRVVDRSWKPIFRDCFVMIMRVIVISMHHDKIRFTWIPQRAVAELKSRLEFVMIKLGFNKNSGDFMLSLI